MRADTKCLICGGTYLDLTSLVFHLESAHGERFRRWADGSLVVVDKTLTPADFGAPPIPEEAPVADARSVRDDVVLAAAYAVAFATAAVVGAAVIGVAAMAALRRGVCR